MRFSIAHSVLTEKSFNGSVRALGGSQIKRETNERDGDVTSNAKKAVDNTARITR